MSALPPELARWEPELSALPRDLAVALARWAGRLAAAVGPWSGGSLEPDGEPDGVAAITRRGSYERLLASEWLLASEAPDEFLRRAASGEHLFLAPAKRAPSADRGLLALFDAGPWQLGAPRLAHVAILIVLARRARSAGARFSWGILQRPEDGPRPSSDPHGIGALLDARCARDPSDADVDAWMTHAPEEVWAVAAPGLADALHARGASAIAVEDPIAIERHALAVRVLRRGRSPQELTLVLPDAALAARAIRDPFQLAVAATAAHVAPRGAALALPVDGRRLVVATESGFASWALPNSPRDKIGSPRRLVLERGEHLLAAGHAGKHLLAVARDGEQLAIYGAFGGESGMHGRPRFTFPYSDDAPWPALGSIASRVVGPDYGGADVTWHDGGERLFTMREKLDAPIVREGVLAFHRRREGALIVVRDGGTTRVAILQRDGRERTLHHDGGGRATAALFAGQDSPDGVVAYARDGALRTWTFVRMAPRSRLELTAPAGTRVAGAHVHREGGGSLVLIEADGRTISVVGRHGSEEVLTASAPIERAVVAPRGPLVAWRTATGWIEVGSIVHHAVVLRIPPEEQPT